MTNFQKRDALQRADRIVKLIIRAELARDWRLRAGVEIHKAARFNAIAMYLQIRYINLTSKIYEDAKEYIQKAEIIG